MNQEWRSLVLGIRNQLPFTKTSAEITKTIASWYQEERDICLILSRAIGERVDLRLSRKHWADSGLRFRDDCSLLVESQELRSVFVIPDAADDLAVTVNLDRRTISCSMRLNAPLDKKRAGARINWLLRQLRKIEGPHVFARAFWPGRVLPTHRSLEDVKNDPNCLDCGKSGLSPTGFEVLLIKDCAGRFSGTRTFVQDLEAVIPDYYDRVGRQLRRWAPPAPAKKERNASLAESAN